MKKLLLVQEFAKDFRERLFSIALLFFHQHPFVIQQIFPPRPSTSRENIPCLQSKRMQTLKLFTLKLLIMAEFKRRTLTLSTGKQIKLYGNSIGIGKSLEIAEGYAPNIFSHISNEEKEKPVSAVSNPHQLTAEEMYELADYSIRLWLDLKDNIRKHGVNNPKVFNSDALR